jgi:hypothetical protein
MAPLSQDSVARLVRPHGELSQNWSEVKSLLQRLGPAWAELRSILNELDAALSQDPPRSSTTSRS